VLGCGIPSIAALTVLAFVLARSGIAATPGRTQATVALGGYTLAFFIFLAGFGAWIRARCTSPMTPRLITFGILFGVCVAPWVLAAIAGVFAEPASAGEAMIVAAPSPLYPLYMASVLEHGGPQRIIVAGWAAALAWVLFGLLFVVLAQRTCARVIAPHEAVLAEADRRLAEEDANAR